MAIEKQDLNLNFSKGLNLKTDPFLVQVGNFLSLKNSIFTNNNLTKRNGFGRLTALPVATCTDLTTFNGALTAIGSSFYSYSSGSMQWVNKGTFQPISLDVLPLVRSNTTQTQCDTVVANELVCTVYTDSIPPTPTATYKYVISDVTTGQNIVSPTLITSTAGTVSGSPRVFVLGSYFIIVFSATITAVNHLQYIAINIYQPSSPLAPVDITANYTPNSHVAWDGFVANNSLYLAWNGNDGGGAIRSKYIDSTLFQHPVVILAGKAATQISVCADTTTSTPVIYISYYNSGTQNLRTACYSASLVNIYDILVNNGAQIDNFTSSALNNNVTVVIELHDAYSYGTTAQTNALVYRTITPGPALGSQVPIRKSLGLASKSVIYNSKIYFLSVYSSNYQPTYFLLDILGTTDGNIDAKLAYSNGGGYIDTTLPSLSAIDDLFYVSYQFKDLVIPVNKAQNASVTQTYAQVGINLAKFDLTSVPIISAEIGGNLNISGGFLTGFDGNVAVESGFHLYPDQVEVTTSTTGGLIADGTYFYQAVYQWTDAQGNIYNSAPSLPIRQATNGGNTSTNTINVPTLRVTSKTANPVKIVLFRSSAAQPTYYQVTSINNPTYNSLTVNSVAITDTLRDDSIVGNSIIYTTGGVLENIGPPATDAMALYKSRLVLIDSEDRNLLWYSKQVIESTPVEMTDLQTIYIAPTTAAQGPTGPITSLAVLDDKLVIGKRDSLFYITGNGPDITGANNDFSEPIFITSTVGCANQRSIVFIPNGLMFQSDKGIWLLGRNLSTSYIGEDVQAFNNDTVLSAVNIPGTNQVRFTMASGVTLMYDYHEAQWIVFDGAPAISSTLYQDLHTIIDQYGRVSQETQGAYLDGSNPVLLSFTTSWINLMGLQGYERAYFFYLLGTYLSPHKLVVSIAYDYNSSPQQSLTISPDNFSAVYGGDNLYGGSPVNGGAPNLEQWRVFFDKQKCQAFQISIQEIYDPSKGVAAGAGLTLTGLNLTVGAKSKYPRINTANTVG